MPDQGPMPGFEPPKTPIEDAHKGARRPLTIGYLIGAILEVVLGAYFLWVGLVGSGTLLPLVLGLFLLGLAIRSIVLYRRSRRDDSRSL
jgi:hypothetical protein